VAWARSSVALTGVSFKGEVPAPVREAAARSLARGLTAAGLKVVQGTPVEQAMGARGGACTSAPCARSLAGKLGCRYVAGGSVKGEDRSYAIDLWMADGYTGRVAARVEQRCEICGLTAVAEKMDLAASALAAKLEAAARAPARLSIRTDPPGAIVSVDGDEVGPAPRDLDLAPGSHEIAARASGYLVTTRVVQGVAGVKDRVELRLVPVPPSAAPRIAGWVGIAAGAASLAAGIALFAINGGSGGCPGEDRGAQCPERYETTAGAATLTALGAAAVGGGIYLLWRSAGRSQERRGTTLSAAGAGQF
jgi:hypothetical protein